jgi:hypothetical protein
MNLRSKTLGILVLVILFGGIMVSSTLGAWNTESTKQPAKFTTGEFAGQANPADIRGSYTFGDIVKAFNIPIEDLKVAFEVPETTDPLTYQVKNLETQFAYLADQGKEVGTASVRYFVALYKGLPFTITEDTYLTTKAVSILKQKATLTSEQIAYIEAHAVETTPASAQLTALPSTSGTPRPTSVASTAKTESAESDKTIKGKTTFNDVLTWGVPKATVEQIIGGTIPSTGMAIKDYCTQKSLDFETIKTKLQAEIDKTK